MFACIADIYQELLCLNNAITYSEQITNAINIFFSAPFINFLALIILAPIPGDLRFFSYQFALANLKLQDDQGPDSAPGDIRMIEVAESSHIIET
jgi:hypothetical protein